MRHVISGLIAGMLLLATTLLVLVISQHFARGQEPEKIGLPAVQHGKKPVLIFFFEKGCAACVRQSVLLTDMGRRHLLDDVTVLRFNVADRPDMAKKYEVTAEGTPTLVFLFLRADGWGARYGRGLQSEQQVKELIALPEPEQQQQCGIRRPQGL